jgi:hypothetical protein
MDTNDCVIINEVGTDQVRTNPVILYTVWDVRGRSADRANWEVLGFVAKYYATCERLLITASKHRIRTLRLGSNSFISLKGEKNLISVRRVSTRVGSADFWPVRQVTSRDSCINSSRRVGSASCITFIEAIHRYHALLHYR